MPPLSLHSLFVQQARTQHVYMVSSNSSRCIRLRKHRRGGGRTKIIGVKAPKNYSFMGKYAKNDFRPFCMGDTPTVIGTVGIKMCPPPPRKLIFELRKIPRRSENSRLFTHPNATPPKSIPKNRMSCIPTSPDLLIVDLPEYSENLLLHTIFLLWYSQ